MSASLLVACAQRHSDATAAKAVSQAAQHPWISEWRKWRADVEAAVDFLIRSSEAPLERRLGFLRRSKGLSEGQISEACRLLDMRTPKHVLFLVPGEAPGHINPLLPLIRSFCESKCVVTVFADGAPTSSAREGEVHDESPLGRAILATGASLRFYRNDGRLASEPRLSATWWGRQFQRLPALVDELRALQPPPTCLIYDVFLGVAPAAAHICGIPSVGMITYCGPGMMVSSESESNRAAFQPIREWLTEICGVDL